MIAPENHPEESERLQALHRLCLLDTGPEPIFHEIVAVAAAVCRTPIALMTLVDEDRQWFKASIIDNIIFFKSSSKLKEFFKFISRYLRSYLS